MVLTEAHGRMRIRGALPRAQLVFPDADGVYAGLTVNDSDRQLGAAKPIGESSGISSDFEPCDRGGRVCEGRSSSSGDTSCSSFDEERQSRLGQGLEHARQPRRHSLPPDCADRRPETHSDRPHVLYRDGPAAERVTSRDRRLQRCAERGALRLLRIDDRQQLDEAAVGKRHDPIMGPEPLVATTRNRRQAERGLNPSCRDVQVCGAIDHVIDTHDQRR
jgi:hypothetical protein